MRIADDRVLLRGGGGEFRGFDGFHAGDVFADAADGVGFLDLAGLLAKAELEELLAGFAELGVDFREGEVVDFLGCHVLKKVGSRKEEGGRSELADESENDFGGCKCRSAFFYFLLSTLF